jgi:hypothetical protein
MKEVYLKGKKYQSSGNGTLVDPETKKIAFVRNGDGNYVEAGNNFKMPVRSKKTASAAQDFGPAKTEPAIGTSANTSTAS